MSTLDEILSAAQLLPPADRAKLISSLWETTRPEDWPPPSPEWITEANRRSDEFDRGAAGGREWAEVRKRARKDAGLDD